MGVDDFDACSVTDSGVFSDNDGCSSGRSSPVSCKEGLGGERERFAILTYDQAKRIDSVLNEMVALEGRGNFPALELKLKDLLTAVKDRLLKEGLKIRDIRLNGGAASYALMPEQLDYCYMCGYGYQNGSGNEDTRLVCSCNVVANATTTTVTAEQCPGGGIMTVNSLVTSGAKSNCSYNDIDLIFGMELSTSKHFDRVKTAVLDALLDLLPPQVSRKRMSACALKEAYVSKMVKVCEGDRWSLIALGNGQPTQGPNGNKSRGCSVELKFVDNMRRQYEFSVDSFQIVLDSLMLFYKCATVPMSTRFYPTIVGESVYGDFNEALFHLHHGLIATRHPEEIRGGGLLKYCSLLVRGYRPADIHSIQPLQRYMCSRFFIDFPEVEQQEVKLRTYLANHMSGVSIRLRYAFLITLYNVVDSSTVCLMGHERRLTLQLIQRLACHLFANDYPGQGLYTPYPCYQTYYMPSSASAGGSNGQTGSSAAGSSGSQQPLCTYDPQSQTVYYNQPLLPGLTTAATATANNGTPSVNLGAQLSSSNSTTGYQYSKSNNNGASSFTNNTAPTGSRQNANNNSAKVSHNVKSSSNNTSGSSNKSTSSSSTLLTSSSSSSYHAKNNEKTIKSSSSSSNNSSNTNNNTCNSSCKIIPVVHLTAAPAT